MSKTRELGTAGRSRILQTMAAALVALLAALSLSASPASAQRMKIGFADTLFRSADADTRETWLKKSRQAGAKIVRLDVKWWSIAPTEPLSPTNPNDPAYRWGTLDAAIADANHQKLDPLLTVSLAPPWAEGPGRQAIAPPGTWKPDPGAYGDFARALAARYGSQVRYYAAWNEPNLTVYLMPQWEGTTPVGALIYRRMLNEFYEGIHETDPTATVSTGGTAPYGDDPGVKRTRPLVFIRELLCLDQNNMPAPECDEKPKFDALDHHPFNSSGGPNLSAAHPDNVSTPDLHNVVDVLRAAEAADTTGTAGPHQVWATEFWWETNPPDPCRGVGLKKHKRWIARALRSFEKQGASVAIHYPDPR